MYEKQKCRLIIKKYDGLKDFLNWISQREKMAWRTYEIYTEDQLAIVKESYLENIGVNRDYSGWDNCIDGVL